jgi:hypothetical protein
MRFYLNDIQTLENLTLMQKLEAVEFKDTYCDLPFLYHRQLLSLFLECVYVREFHI